MPDACDARCLSYPASWMRTMPTQTSGNLSEPETESTDPTNIIGVFHPTSTSDTAWIDSERSFHSPCLRPSLACPALLNGTYLRYAIVFSVCRLGIATPADVFGHLVDHHFLVNGARPIEVVRSAMKRASAGTHMRAMPPLRRMEDGRFTVRRPPFADSTRRRWEQRLPTLCGTR